MKLAWKKGGWVAPGNHITIAKTALWMPRVASSTALVIALTGKGQLFQEDGWSLPLIESRWDETAIFWRGP